MPLPLLLLVFVTAMLALAAWADRHFRRHARLPMQWSLTGTINWSAPRRVAVFFIPIVAGVTLGSLTLLSLVLAPRAGQENEVLPSFAIAGSLCVACQLLHLWFVALTLRRARR